MLQTLRWLLHCKRRAISRFYGEFFRFWAPVLSHKLIGRKKLPFFLSRLAELEVLKYTVGEYFLIQ